MVQKVQLWKLRLGERNALLWVTGGFKALQSDQSRGLSSAAALAKDFVGHVFRQLGLTEASLSPSSSQIER